MPKKRHQHSKKTRSAFGGYKQAVTAAAQIVADRDKTDKDRGLYSKYEVRRVDGENVKHAKCEYFVLDITHDPHALPAIFSYAHSAGADGYKKLQADLYGKIQPYIKMLNEAVIEQAAEDSLTFNEIAVLSAEDLIKISSNVWATLDGEDALIIQELIERYQQVARVPQAVINGVLAGMDEEQKKTELSDTAAIIRTDAAPTTNVAEVVKAALPKKIAAKPAVKRPAKKKE